MTDLHRLPVAVHVAKREAGRMIERGRVSMVRWQEFLDGLMTQVMDRYCTGRPLDRAGYHALVSDVRAALEGLSPTRLHEASVAPTRTRPKGEGHEFLALVAYGNDLAWFSRTGFIGLRVHVTRKRVLIDQEFVGFDVTRHALERTVERAFTPGIDRLAGVQDALAAHAGLVVVWRWAMYRHGITEQVALPMGDDLLLGRIERVPCEGMNLSFMLDRQGVSSGNHPQNDLQVSIDERGEWFMPFLGCTVIDDTLMRIQQVDLRDALAAFSRANADLLSDLGRYASWGRPALNEREGFFDVRERLEAAAVDLAAIVARPAHEGALQPRDSGGGSSPRCAYPEGIMSDPRQRVSRLLAHHRRAA